MLPGNLVLWQIVGIGPRGCAELCKGLSKNKVLQELNLQENRLGDDGFTALGNALAINTTLQQLALGGNQHHTDIGLIYLAHGIRCGARRATQRAAPLHLTGVDLAKVADVIGLLAFLCVKVLEWMEFYRPVAALGRVQTTYARDSWALMNNIYVVQAWSQPPEVGIPSR